jgi:hypothetical protein
LWFLKVLGGLVVLLKYANVHVLALPANAGFFPGSSMSLLPREGFLAMQQ